MCGVALSAELTGKPEGRGLKLVRERGTGRRLSRRLFVIAGGATVTAAGAAALLPSRCDGKFYPGVTVAGISLGGLSRAEAEAALEARTASFQQRAITYVYQDRTWICTAQQLGISIDYDKTLQGAWEFGRNSGITSRYEALLDRGSYQAPLMLSVDDAALSSALSGIAGELNEQPVDATFAIDGVNVNVTPEKPGRSLNIDEARKASYDTLSSLEPSTVMLRVDVVPAEITAAHLEPSREAAARIVSHKVTIKHGDTRWTIEREDLARAVIVPNDPVKTEPVLDPGTLKLILQHIADETNSDPVNAAIAWDGSKVVATSDSKPGVSVDLDKLVDDVIAAAGKASGRTVSLPVSDVAPDIDAKHLDKLGIVTLMGEGSSSFEGSSDARATNVQVSADKINHSIIPPGGSYSFLDSIGTISVDAGFVEGKIISGGWYATDIGGGVCQVSTTVYRAALLAGLPFAEWHPHSVRVSFYELDGWPVGMDATIFQPETPDAGITLDLVFTNPTDSWILLQTSISDDRVYCDLYGAQTGYQVTVSDPVISDETDPPTDPLIKQTSDLPAGDREQTQTAQGGFTTTLTRQVTLDGQVIEDDTFVSIYAPVADAFMVGTG